MKRPPTPASSTEPMAYGFLAGAYFFLLALLAMQLACAGPPPPARALSLDELGLLDRRSVSVAVLCGQEMSMGSGVLIGADYVLTAAHVVDCPPDKPRVVAIKNIDGLIQTAKVHYLWPGRDTARLQIVAPTGNVTGLPRGRFVTGQRVCSPVPFPQRATICGEARETHTTECPQDEWCHNARVSGAYRSGNSGAPLYNNNGELVGIITGAYMMQGLPLGLGLAMTLGGIEKEVLP